MGTLIGLILLICLIFVQPFGLKGHVLLGEAPGRAEGDETVKYKSVVM
jgi:hypothetical protein